jgi:signal peptidase I
MNSEPSTQPELSVNTADQGHPTGRIIRDVALVLSVLATIGLALVVAVLHIHFMRVISPSMEPSVRVGDVVVLKPVSTANLAEGQIVVLPVPDEGGVMYAHRLTSVRKVDGKVVVTTKGDANPAPDPWELQIESASVPLVVGQIPVPGVFAGIGGPGMTQVLVVLLLALIATPMMMGIIRRTRVGTRLRALPLRLSDRRHR